MSEMNQSEAASAGGEQGAGGNVASGQVASDHVTNGHGTVDSTTLPLRDRVENVLRTVYDPEIPVNIFDLGLVYEISIGDNGAVKITMTLTAPACPAAGEIIHDVQEKVGAVEGVSDCHVQLTFDPAWTKDMMTEEAKLELGFM